MIQYTSGLWTFNRTLYCNCHHGPERIHSELLNILLAFPCRMYPMDYERTGFYVAYGVYAFYTL